MRFLFAIIVQYTTKLYSNYSDPSLKRALIALQRNPLLIIKALISKGPLYYPYRSLIGPLKESKALKAP